MLSWVVSMRSDDFVDVMDSFVGVLETPPGSNHTPIGVEYGWNGVPWCAEEVSVAAHRLGFPLHEAAVIRIEAHARVGDFGMTWTTTPTRGAIVCFDFGGRGIPGDMHTGVVKEVYLDGTFRSIEGNYRDRCAVVLRDMKYVRGFAVPPFEDVPVPPRQPESKPAQHSPSVFEPWPHREKMTIRRGAKGNIVAYLQRVIALKAGGNIAVDGDFGYKTEARVKTVQKQNGLVTDGIVGPHTWATIDHLASP